MCRYHFAVAFLHVYIAKPHQGRNMLLLGLCLLLLLSQEPLHPVPSLTAHLPAFSSLRYAHAVSFHPAVPSPTSASPELRLNPSVQAGGWGVYFGRKQEGNGGLGLPNSESIQDQLPASSPGRSNQLGSSSVGDRELCFIPEAPPQTLLAFGGFCIDFFFLFFGHGVSIIVLLREHSVL